MKKNVFLSVACLASLMFLGSCNSSKNMAAIAKDFNSSWNVTTINDTLNFTNENLEKAPTLNFNWEEKRVSGKTGCNSYFATFEVPAKGTIKFGNAGATKMFCIESMYIEDAFLGAFNKVAKYSINKRTLRLYDANGNLLIEASKVQQ